MSQHKRGDTFDVSGQIDVTVSGAAVADMTGWVGACQMRSSNGVLIAEPAFTWINAAQRLIRLRVSDTTGWPLGNHEVDIQLTMPSGDIVSTATAQIEIVKDITRPA